MTLSFRIISAQQQQLSLFDIFTVLRSKKASLPEKNQLLTEGVRQRGITFAINADIEKELRSAGADDNLIEAIRQKSPVVKPSPTPLPSPEPKPTPVATPKPPDFAYYQNRANASFVMGEYDAAINDYTKAIELNSKEASIYFSRGMAFYNKQSFNRAIADFDKAIELDADESMAYYNRGNALEKVGNFEKALGDYQKAVELDADNEPAKNALQRLKVALAKNNPSFSPSSFPIPSPASTPVKDEVKEKSDPTKEVKEIAQAVNPDEPVNVDSLKELAIRLVTPVYPLVERQRNIEGLVTVQITIDEEGKVISAKAISGPRGLRVASEEAARRSRFRSVLVNNKAVKATGFIVYNFKVS
jgi:TonB family protein